MARVVGDEDSEDRVEITNCHSNVRICVTGIRTLDAGVGGIAGQAEYAKISNCSNGGSVKIASEGRGGLTYYTGGILGIGASGSRIEACCNTGEIWCAHAAGGLSGGVKGRNPGC